MTHEAKETSNAELLASYAAAVAEATKQYEQEKSAESLARNRCTSALNDLNAAQRNLDKALADMRKAAPPDSDWQRAPMYQIGDD